MADRPHISAAICTRNRADLIGAAVQSVLANDYPTFQLLVLDQSDDDSTKRALEPFAGDPRLRYVHLERPGLSAAYNQAIALTDAPLLAFTDDDCLAPPRWLSSIEAAFARHPDAEMLYGQTLAAPELAGAPGVLPALPISEERKLGPGYGFQVFGMGANFAMRRTLFERIAGFDEALGGGGPLRSSQDFDYLFRAYRKGAVCLLTPEVWVHHYGIRNEDEWPATLKAYGIGDGAFYLKHVRCGDLMALRLLVGRMARLFLRALRNSILGRPAEWVYLRSYLTGMRASLRFPVDRERRLYGPAGGR